MPFILSLSFCLSLLVDPSSCCCCSLAWKPLTKLLVCQETSDLKLFTFNGGQTSPLATKMLDIFAQMA